ncbi:MAG: hypothetical protein CM15mP65_29440 [Crocinitomicaceae bacterium]|nr:MAG: hypothetical protein CM15mP65_29440 [Crocinitomicaceae bacterium]
MYTLTDVTIHNITGGWGPEYIPFLYTNNKPDPYFIVKENGNLIYQSSFVLNDNGPNTWQVNINLDPDSNYTLRFGMLTKQLPQLTNMNLYLDPMII